jgi:predicted dehydrogenase
MKKIRIGIFGAGRGINIAENLLHQDCEIAALCDFNKKRLLKGKEELGIDVPLFEDFDTFIEQNLDAVVIANYFHEHTPYAIKCFEKGIHVLCECITNGTMAEGVELLRAFENSSSIFMLAENYPQMKFNREMKRICDEGTLGKIIFAEGEYNHPVSPEDTGFLKDYIYFPEHWRNYLPRSYYITHSLAPLMWATGATPRTVSAVPVFSPIPEKVTSRMVGDRAAIITTVNDDNSVFRVTGCAGFGAHHNSYRFCGEHGQIENLRGMGEQVMLRYSDWAIPEGRKEVNLYEPSWNDKDEDLIENSGHGGGDFIVTRMFLDCIRENRQPEHPYDIYSAVTMASVAILGHRSVLEGGKPYAIPDFHLEECRKEYENDRSTPFYCTDGRTPDIPCCSKTDYKPTDEQMEAYMELSKSW